jgi:uncharacterized protein YheU (UPF0270 family)
VVSGIGRKPGTPEDSGRMVIPYQKLSLEALHDVIEEVVTRDGTETSDAEAKIAEVMDLLEQGKVVITYDMESRTCSIVPAGSVPNRGDA